MRRVFGCDIGNGGDPFTVMTNRASRSIMHSDRRWPCGLLFGVKGGLPGYPKIDRDPIQTAFDAIYTHLDIHRLFFNLFLLCLPPASEARMPTQDMLAPF